MKPLSPSPSAIIVILTAAGALAATLAVQLLAQYQVNPMVNNTANRAVVGGTTSGTVRYAGVNPQVAARTSQITKSEFRYEYYKSGATPSSLRMGYAAVGPMAEGGALAYINYKPEHLKPKPAPTQSPQGSAAYSMGSVRYGSTTPAPTPALVTAPRMDAMIGAPKPVYPSLIHKPVPTVPLTSAGSIRYVP